MNTLKLTPGKFYRSRDGEVWCCYRVRLDREEHCQADCIRVSDSRVEYFYLNGFYDSAGKREHCLLDEVDVEPSSVFDTKTEEFIIAEPSTLTVGSFALIAKEPPPKLPTCAACNDSHFMDLGDRFRVMCTWCPVPCNNCRPETGGVFCKSTPCTCSCHT